LERAHFSARQRIPTMEERRSCFSERHCFSVTTTTAHRSNGEVASLLTAAAAAGDYCCQLVMASAFAVAGQRGPPPLSLA
jgi:hypothetical protein